MASIIDRRTIDFLLFDVLNVSGICGHGRFSDHDQESLSAVLDLAQKIAEEDLWPHSQKTDVEEPYLENGQVRILQEVKDAQGIFREAGFFSAHCDYELGGMQLPVSVNNACNGMFKGANVAAHSYMSLTRAAANLLEVHGNEEQKKLLMLPMLQGRYFGTMCLSEPDAGSSLSDLKTRAVQKEDGTFAITGNKMWISAGDHDASENIVHLVLARLPDAPAGVKGISLFAVPKVRVETDGSLGERNGVTVAGLNHKMGYRGVSNCLLNFGESKPAVGTMVGEPNRGLTAMFHMMNEARISVGIGAAMLGSVGYRIALDYAKERRQGRRFSEKEPTSKPVAIIEHPDVRRMLMKQKVYTEGAIALCLYAGMLVDRHAVANDEAERQRLTDLLDIVTPIVKAWPSEFGLEANKLAIQVLGGYGYTRDFPVEKLYRDNRLNMIHEGTNGIQALDLLGRKAIMNNGRAFDALVKEVQETAATAQGTDYADYAETLLTLFGKAAAHAAATGKAIAQGKAEHSLALASPFLNGLGHLVVGWLWLRQALAADTAIPENKDIDFLQGKLAACRWFFEQEIPEAVTWLENAARSPDTLLGVPENGL